MKFRPLWLILPSAAALHAGLLWWARDIPVFRARARDETPFTVNFFTEDVPLGNSLADKAAGWERRFTVSTAFIEKPAGPATQHENPLDTSAFPAPVLPRPLPLSPPAPARVCLFNLSGESRRVVYLIDASGGMWRKQSGRTRIETARREVARSILALPEDAQFNVIYFADRPAALAPEPLYASARAKAEAASFLAAPPALRGETNFVDGLGAAFQQRPDNLFIITDGLANQDAGEVAACAEALRQRYAAQSKVHAIGLGLPEKGVEAGLLKKLSLPTQGSFEIQN